MLFYKGSLSRRRFLGGSLAATALLMSDRAFAAPSLQFRWIADGVYLHVSWIPSAHGFAPSNGLVILGQDSLLIVDTPRSIAETEEMLDRIVGYDDKQLVITHAHGDRMAGLKAIQARGIPSLAHETTVKAAVARTQGAIDAAWTGEAHTLDVGGRRVELFYPGPAHTSDNTVAYIEDCAVLYGACMVRALDRNDLGGLGGADGCYWPQAVRTLQERYKKARIVVPGHGDPGDQRLLTHTLALAEAERGKLDCGEAIITPSP